MHLGLAALFSYCLSHTVPRNFSMIPATRRAATERFLRDDGLTTRNHSGGGRLYRQSRNIYPREAFFTAPLLPASLAHDLFLEFK